jgi:hypothetical protein
MQGAPGVGEWRKTHLQAIRLLARVAAQVV